MLTSDISCCRASGVPKLFALLYYFRRLNAGVFLFRLLETQRKRAIDRGERVIKQLCRSASDITYGRHKFILMA
jgi:hypothetical protein